MTLGALPVDYQLVLLIGGIPVAAFVLFYVIGLVWSKYIPGLSHNLKFIGYCNEALAALNTAQAAFPQAFNDPNVRLDDWAEEVIKAALAGRNIDPAVEQEVIVFVLKNIGVGLLTAARAK
jgi:hypothetical protein